MTILVISNMYPSEKDPVYGTFVKCFVNDLVSRNQPSEVSISVIRGRDGNFFRKLYKYIKFYLYTFHLTLFKKYDIIYVHTITYPILPLYCVTKLKRLPLVFNVHGGDVLTHGKLAGKLKQTARPLLKNALMIVTPSNYFKKVVLTEFPELEEDKIYVSPSGGINLNLFRPITKYELRQCFTVGYVSRIDEKKGWDTFINALSQLKLKGLNCKAVMAGRGAKQQELQTLIHRLHLGDYIDYRGAVPYEQLPEIYEQMDIFVFPTCLHESLGLVGIEAMACGIPVIGSLIGGLTDYLEEGFNGFYYSPGSVEELSACIEKYILLPRRDKERMRNNALQTAATYDSSIVGNCLYRKLQHLIAEQ